MSGEYIKALSVRNTADMVYARQVFHEPGMLPGFHLARMYDGVEVIPDKGWIVWMASLGALYDTMTDEEFCAQYTHYEALPPAQKAICDAHPSYEEWVEAMDQEFDQKGNTHAADPGRI